MVEHVDRPHRGQAIFFLLANHLTLQLLHTKYHRRDCSMRDTWETASTSVRRLGCMDITASFFNGPAWNFKDFKHGRNSLGIL